MTNGPNCTALLFDLTHTRAAALLARTDFPWEALPSLGGFLRALAAAGAEDYRLLADGVLVHVSARISPAAYLGAPCVIGAGTEIRQGAYVRGNVLVGDGCVVGNSSELKNCILFDGVQAPHFNYVGDSVLGCRVHLGAGAVCSNLKGDRSEVCAAIFGQNVHTGLKKCGAFLGDFTEVGCNSVLNPGTVTGKGVRFYPLSNARGFYPAGTLVKTPASR